MKLVFTKKFAILAALLVLIGTAAFVLYNLTKKSEHAVSFKIN